MVVKLRVPSCGNHSILMACVLSACSQYWAASSQANFLAGWRSTQSAHGNGYVAWAVGC